MAFTLQYLWVTGAVSERPLACVERAVLRLRASGREFIWRADTDDYIDSPVQKMDGK